MSDEEEFQSADKQCSLEIVNVNHFPGYNITPKKTIHENSIAWKFEKIKRAVAISRSPTKNDNRNISFQSEYLEEVSDEQKDSDGEDRVSCLTEKYRNQNQIYKKQRVMGTSWLCHRQYFASIFLDPTKLSKPDKQIFKPNPPPPPISSPSPHLTFNSQFESGNLFTAFKINQNEYDLILQNDINSKGNTQWFYFQIIKVPARTKIKFNIINMLKSDSLFNYGMQPCVYSSQGARRNGQGWVRSGSGVRYFRNQNKVDGANRNYYTLTFTIMTPYQGDTLRIAQSYPYTFENLTNFLDGVEKKPGRKSYMKRETIGQTIGKNKIDVIKILEDNPRKKGLRPLIIITARQHPGQTPSSYACQGFIEFITSDEKQACFLRKNYEICVIPMINPDGVQVGNYRTNLCGVDLNRRWDGSKSQQAAQTMLVKKYLIDIAKNREVAFMIDLHGHSRNFFYGNMVEEKPIEVRLFPYICAKSSEGMIRFQDSTFVCEEEKKRTARVQMASKFKTPNVFTFEISFYGYINKNKEKVHFNQQKLKSLGAVLGHSMFLHERYKYSSDSIEATIVKKYIDEMNSKPDLIKYGEKAGSGSESEPQKGQMNEQQFQNVTEQKQIQLCEQEKTQAKPRVTKKQTIKQIVKQSRQMHVMDIARVNSIFPNDILALMPSSFTKKVKDKDKQKEKEKEKEREREKVVKDHSNVLVQTMDVPIIKIYDICTLQDNKQEKQISVRKRAGTKNQVDVNALTSRSNLFRTVVRPKSSSNSYLQSHLQIPSVKSDNKKRHESGIEIKDKKQRSRASKSTQTKVTFPPEADFMARTLDSLIISPASKGLQLIRRKTNFATISPQIISTSTTKTSNQSFKIGLRALNVQTWRIKKKSFQ